MVVSGGYKFRQTGVGGGALKPELRASTYLLANLP